MHAGGQRFDPAQLHQYLDRSMNAWLRSVCRNKRFGLMTRVVKRKFFFLITGSDLLFNKLDEIEHECISLIISERNRFNVIAISSVIRCCR